jgi:hypothetical protein
VGEDAEVTEVLESLVADNEELERSHGELQLFLEESWGSHQVSQPEVEKLRVSPPSPNRM